MNTKWRVLTPEVLEKKQKKKMSLPLIRFFDPFISASQATARCTAAKTRADCFACTEQHRYFQWKSNQLQSGSRFPPSVYYIIIHVIIYVLIISNRPRDLLRQTRHGYATIIVKKQAFRRCPASPPPPPPLSMAYTVALLHFPVWFFWTVRRTSLYLPNIQHTDLSESIIL